MQVSHRPISSIEVSPEVSQVFAHAAAGLAALEFELRGHATHFTENTGQNSFVSLWMNHALSESAQVIGILTPSRDLPIRAVALVTFRTEFTDGTSIVTSSSSGASAFPADPRVRSIRCPGVRDISLLHSLHRARLERDRGCRLATLERSRDACSRLQLEHQETYCRLVDEGYYVIDAARQRYVPTLKGAFLMTYRLLPPFKQLQKRMKDRLADKTLRELGFGSLEEFRQSSSVPAPLMHQI